MMRMEQGGRLAPFLAFSRPILISILALLGLHSANPFYICTCNAAYDTGHVRVVIEVRARGMNSMFLPLATIRQLIVNVCPTLTFMLNLATQQYIDK